MRGVLLSLVVVHKRCDDCWMALLTLARRGERATLNRDAHAHATRPFCVLPLSRTSDPSDWKGLSVR